VHIPAYIEIGGSRVECTILNMSAGGAMLAVAASQPIPDAFTLLITPSGSLSRRCMVAWREVNRIGVAFEANHPVIH
jgi:hypothetical protein